ncbi:AraC-like DNA-binding protein [Lactobacillus colini]|uniref:AraC-like DNA-binding protein n=1 Tax=Lactobacillus colini TaxID=1819254 RepID=A0ABS4MBY2_9LACO|nr:helix-turn-helix domain-containing protein [Lactobacillus colini]MBP2057192.1 AraC-like DNA-binding protein [Lactobacillus colini]
MKNELCKKLTYSTLLKAAYAVSDKENKLVPFKEIIKYLQRPNRVLSDISLTSDEFIDSILNTEINPSVVSDSLVSKDQEDSTLIPEDKDIFAFLHLNRLKNNLYDHNCIEILYVYSGSIEFIFGKEHTHLKSGSVCFISPKSMHNIVVNDDSFALSILIRNKTLSDVLPSKLNSYNLIAEFINHILLSEKAITNYLLFQISDNDALKSSIKQLVQESFIPTDTYSDSLMISWLRIFLFNLLRAKGISSVHDSLHKTANLTPIINYIGENYNWITLANLAKTFNYNESYLSSLIHKAFGKSFSTMLNNIRLSHAVDYLLSTDLTLSNIAEKIGYQSVDYFIRNFKKHYKMTPGAYRSLHNS